MGHVGDCAAVSAGSDGKSPPGHFYSWVLLQKGNPAQRKNDSASLTNLVLPPEPEDMVNASNLRQALEPRRLDSPAGQGWHSLPSGEKESTGQGVPCKLLEPGMHDRPGAGMHAPVQPAVVSPGVAPYRPAGHT